MQRTVAILFLCVTLAACTPRGAIVIMPDSAKIGVTEPVYIGTTRAADPETGELFSGKRNQSTRFARLDVTIPPEREPGEIKWPRKNRPPDPGTEFLTSREVLYRNAPAFRADLADALGRQRRGRREAIVFVHGFNNTFAEGAYRLAQLGHDIGIDGALIHYSWPSIAHPLGYAYDRDSALFARDGLEHLIHEVIAAGADRVILVAHSMGSALTMEALRQIAIEDDHKRLDRIAAVVLMSPDLDVDVFRAQALRIGELPQPFLIFTSRKDRALALSARLTGQRNRLGNVADVTEVADLNVTLLDTTAFSTGAGHFDAGNSRALISILGSMRDVDAALAGDQTGRTGLLPGAVLTVQSATGVVLSPVATLSGAMN
ncbi:hypothetical protein DEA8626_02590 [Defluviimonas aquaemixtae]|uniref:Esterase/lipase superfamily enzyme n=1 Tax=Albidovulum aquaemixtae TaxID=1542388 RepID=A0A2R8BJE3_9RHOB|nr:alpha/beta fold hydrolase [Defluviimonas aquaemixtae]SPH23526.1 hypothetical protein DEA8626_02590 [Defluviimonas aquaemixtae]